MHTSNFFEFDNSFNNNALLQAILLLTQAKKIHNGAIKIIIPQDLEFENRHIHHF